MKILENLLPICQETETETSNLMWLSGQPCGLHMFNLKSRRKTTHEIMIPKIELEQSSCDCLLPDNKIFCSGSFEWKTIEHIYFIINEDYSVKILPSQVIYMGCSATYYNNYVYICGDATVIRFDLINWRWEQLARLSVWSYSHTCVPFNGMILISGIDFRDIFMLDLLSLSLSSCQLRLETNWTKILFKWENSAYLVDFSGKIYKSDNGNPFNWNFIGNCNPLKRCIYGHKAFYKDSLYFYAGLFLLKFDPNKKNLEKIDLPFD
ncbi:unnamed protein product [Blepharisma stoltei]|uniref:F-box/kelch-repeat protein n=1 Tax=Blepharisma stoltei TaxID=1481888 RepID=A0AAU9J837_9CILI|nr:unnamed protein product [Blepharisma stoltei]